ELADDLRRFVDDKPIVARPPGMRERATKWSRRHRPLVVAVAAVVLLAAIAGPLAALHEMSLRADAERAEHLEKEQRLIADRARQQESEQRQLADAQRRQAEAVADVLESTFE